MMSNSQQPEFLNDCQKIVEWLTSQNLAPGTLREFRLPSDWTALSHDGTVQAGRTQDGYLCFLLKRQIGWKGNFNGLFYCDRGLKEDEMIEATIAASYLSLSGLGTFEELYIRERYSNQLFEVYFDLN